MNAHQIAVATAIASTRMKSKKRAPSGGCLVVLALALVALAVFGCH